MSKRGLDAGGACIGSVVLTVLSALCAEPWPHYVMPHGMSHSAAESSVDPHALCKLWSHMLGHTAHPGIMVPAMVA